MYSVGDARNSEQRCAIFWYIALPDINAKIHRMQKKNTLRARQRSGDTFSRREQVSINRGMRVFRGVTQIMWAKWFSPPSETGACFGVVCERFLLYML